MKKIKIPKELLKSIIDNDIEYFEIINETEDVLGLSCGDCSGHLELRISNKDL